MPEDASVDDSKSDSVLSRKLKKILDSKLETDKDTVDALKELSTFFQDNNLKTRRNLRGEIERRNLQINRQSLTYGIGRYFFKDLLRYPQVREGVYALSRLSS